VVACPDLQLNELKRAGLLAQLRATENRDLLAGTYDPDGYYSGVYLDMESIAYNPVRLKAAGLKPPKTWDDFAAKEWARSIQPLRDRLRMVRRAQALLRQGSHRRARPRARGRTSRDSSPGHTLAISLAVTGEVLATVNTSATRPCSRRTPAPDRAGEPHSDRDRTVRRRGHEDGPTPQRGAPARPLAPLPATRNSGSRTRCTVPPPARMSKTTRGCSTRKFATS